LDRDFAADLQGHRHYHNQRGNSRTRSLIISTAEGGKMRKHRFSSINPNTGKEVFTIVWAKDYWAASKKAHSMLRGHTIDQGCRGRKSQRNKRPQGHGIGFFVKILKLGLRPRNAQGGQKNVKLF